MKLDYINFDMTQKKHITTIIFYFVHFIADRGYRAAAL